MTTKKDNVKNLSIFLGIFALIIYTYLSLTTDGKYVYQVLGFSINIILLLGIITGMLWGGQYSWHNTMVAIITKFYFNIALFFIIFTPGYTFNNYIILLFMYQFVSIFVGIYLYLLYKDKPDFKDLYKGANHETI